MTKVFLTGFSIILLSCCVYGQSEQKRPILSSQKNIINPGDSMEQGISPKGVHLKKPVLSAYKNGNVPNNSDTASSKSDTTNYREPKRKVLKSSKNPR